MLYVISSTLFLAEVGIYGLLFAGFNLTQDLDVQPAIAVPVTQIKYRMFHTFQSISDSKIIIIFMTKMNKTKAKNGKTDVMSI